VCRATAPRPQAKLKKKQIFVDTLTSKVFMGFTLQPKSASEID